MSLADRVTQGVLDALAREGGLDGVAMFDAPPVRAVPPFVMVLPPVLADWGTKGAAGAELRLMVRIEDAGERPVRLGAIADATERAVLAMPPPEGWQAGATVRLRRRTTHSADSRAGPGRWIGVIEFRMRMLATGPADEGDE